MTRAIAMALACLMMTVLTPVWSAQAQSTDDPYSIMRPEPRDATPEPWLPPKYKSPRGTRQHIRPRYPTPSLPAPTAKVPPPIVVPETGRVLPNLPSTSPSGPNATETFQDRATRCAHQAGAYGDAAGNRSAYIGTCINQ